MSQHPADLKPRNVKPPHGLVPWECLPPVHMPRLIRAARGDFPRSGWAEDVAFACRLLTLILCEIGIDPVARVMGYGAAKYAPWNWQGFAWDRESRTEYRSALFRHLQADAGGELNDPESGEPHKAHAAACCLIWIWHETIGAGVKEAPAPAPAPEPAEGWYRAPLGAARFADALQGGTMRARWTDCEGSHSTILPVRTIRTWTKIADTDVREGDWAANRHAAGIVEFVRMLGSERVLGVPTGLPWGETRASDGRSFYTFCEGSRTDFAPRLSL